MQSIYFNNNFSVKPNLLLSSRQMDIAIKKKGYWKPPQSLAICIFAQTTANYSADLKTRIKACQFGGNSDCSRCGCIASAGLSSVGKYRFGGIIPLKSLLEERRTQLEKLPPKSAQRNNRKFHECREFN